MPGVDYRVLEVRWHERLRRAAADYEAAARQYQRTLDEWHYEAGSDRHLALKQAAAMEASALERYRLTMQVFSDLILRRKLPPPE